jgi:hypothetical protein
MGTAKFAGYKGGRDEAGGTTIVEYLSALNRAQEMANLSRKEFCNVLLSTTTGRAHTLILDWLENGEQIEDIYFGLLTNFDTRVSAEDSRTRLLTYKASKYSTLAKTEADIMTLSGRAATTMPSGPSRHAIYNLEAVNALIRCLPTNSSNTASNVFHSLSAELGRAASFTELSRALNIYRHTVDIDIKQHGIETGSRQQKGFAPGAKPSNTGATSKKGWGAKKNSAKGFALNAGGYAGGQQQQGHQGNTVGSKPPAGHKSDGKGYSKGGSNGKGKGGFGKGGGYKGHQSHNAPRQGEYCSLCGNIDHKAIHGCPYMVADTGKIIPYQPTQGVCSACPPSILPRLNHAERICPYRSGGPLEGTVQK